jgi:hypothetical protein
MILEPPLQSFRFFERHHVVQRRVFLKISDVLLPQISATFSNRMDRHDWPSEGLAIQAVRKSKFTKSQTAYALKQTGLRIRVDEV